MRIASFVLCLIGVAGAGFVGYSWFSDLQDPRTKRELEKSFRTLEALKQLGGGAAVESVQKRVDTLISNRELGWKVLFAAAGLGLIGGFLVMNFRGLIGALLMLPAPLFAGYLELGTLLFTFPLVLGGIFAIFVWPKPKQKKEKDKKGKQEQKREESMVDIEVEVEEDYEVAVEEDADSDAVIVEEEEAPVTSKKQEAIKQPEEEFSIEQLQREEPVQVKKPARVESRPMIDIFRCYSCDMVLRTPKPVPVGKKIRCPHCEQVTRIIPLPE